ncbi:MAG: hypothetical protein JL50_08570 [Peptococcaceae bacterium BICA1-7]|nr:MAG: hypothetical protein JL50_08570 [Peptococcaceae bacterium BICA1-7]HBV97383.1 EAL domain-containing protein [Desulfotomaculum sp.]
MELSRLKNNVTIVFQPIHDLVSGTGEILGFEALARGPDGPLYFPCNLFREAARERILDHVELLCFNLALKNFRILQHLGTSIFINFSPHTIVKHYPEIINRLKKFKGNAVIELIEYSITGKARGELLTALGYLHSAGFRIALDDMGNGDRDLGSICELPADIIKIDRKIIQGLTKNGNAQKYKIMLNTLVGLARNLKMIVIAEGIETEIQQNGVMEAGITMAQGFFLSMPKPAAFWANQLKDEKSNIKIAGER